MTKINKHIEIVRSSKSGLSSMSQRSCDAIFAVLSNHYTSVGITIINNETDLKALAALKPDLVFVGMKFVYANPIFGVKSSIKIWITRFLDQNEIAYTGSGPQAHKLECNKHLAKQNALKAGYKTSPYVVIKQNQHFDPSTISLTFPVFIKPTSRGGGEGIDSQSVAYTAKALQSKVRSIADSLGSDSLIEEYLPGREYSVAILKDENNLDYLVLPIEKIAPLNNNGDRILSQKIKTADTVSDHLIIDHTVKTQLAELALNIFHAIGARDYGRIDIRMDNANIPHFLEANLLPSLIKGYGSFPKACELNIKLDYETMILRIAKLGLAHNLAPKIVTIPLHNNSVTALEA